MTRAFSDFSADMKRLALSIEQEANKKLVEIGAQAGTNIANANPIDTGLSSGNWQASTGTPITDVVKSYMPSSTEQRMNQFKSTKKRTGESVYVANNVDYVRMLNMFGSSVQAPVPFWVERESEKAIKEVFATAKFTKV